MTPDTTDRPDDVRSSHARAPVTGEERARIVELIRAGRSRNSIAREVGRSPSTVSLIAESEGLTFDRSEVEAATKARQADNREKRARLQALLLDDALKIREQLWKPALVYNWSKDNDYAEHLLDRPDFAGQNAIMRTVGVAIDKATKLAEVDSGHANVDTARSVIVTLGEQIRAAVGEYKNPDDTDDSEGGG